MGLLVKVGDISDLPPAPKNWPKCGNYAYQESSPDQPDILKKIILILYKFILRFL